MSLEYLTQQYAGLLSDNTVMKLFEKLTEIYDGNKSKTADVCKIARKTAYDWPTKKETIKHSTKQKILEQALEKIPEHTLESLLKQLSNSSTDVLFSYLLASYENAATSDTSEEFKQWLQKFSTTAEKYSGWIYKKLDVEVEDLLVRLKHQAEDRNIDWEKPTVHLQRKYKTDNEDETYFGTDRKSNIGINSQKTSSEIQEINQRLKPKSFNKSPPLLETRGSV